MTFSAPGYLWSGLTGLASCLQKPYGNSKLCGCSSALNLKRPVWPWQLTLDMKTGQVLTHTPCSSLTYFKKVFAFATLSGWLLDTEHRELSGSLPGATKDPFLHRAAAIKTKHLVVPLGLKSLPRCSEASASAVPPRPLSFVLWDRQLSENKGSKNEQWRFQKTGP